MTLQNRQSPGLVACGCQAFIPALLFEPSVSDKFVCASLAEEGHILTIIFAAQEKVDCDFGVPSGHRHKAKHSPEFDPEIALESAFLNLPNLPPITENSLCNSSQTQTGETVNVMAFSVQSYTSSCHEVRSSRPTGNLPTLDLDDFISWHEELRVTCSLTTFASSSSENNDQIVPNGQV